MRPLPYRHVFCRLPSIADDDGAGRAVIIYESSRRLVSTVADGSAAVVTKPYALRSAHVLRPRGKIRLKVAPCFGLTLSPTELIQRVLRPKSRRTMASATTDAAGTAVLSERWLMALCGFAGQHVDRTQGLGDGRNRLHGTAYANHLAIGPYRLQCRLRGWTDGRYGRRALDHDLIVRLQPGREASRKPSPISTPLNA